MRNIFKKLAAVLLMFGLLCCTSCGGEDNTVSSATPSAASSTMSSSVEQVGDFPIIIIPGVMGTELVSADNTTVWPTDLDFSGMFTDMGNISSMFGSMSGDIDFSQFIGSDGTFDIAGIIAAYMNSFDISALFDPLRLDDNCSGGDISPVQYSPLTEDDIKSGIGTIDTYTVLAEFLCDVYGYENVYFFGYDWRMSNIDSAEALAEYITGVLEETGAEKVNIVAHSMGGLVTSAYLASHKNDNKLASVITCGTPFEGSSELEKLIDGEYDFASAIASYGIDISMFEGFIDFSALTEVFKSMPAVYELMDGATCQHFLEDVNAIDGTSVLRDKVEAYYNTVYTKMSSVWEGIDHTVIVGTGSETGADGADGDGSVTLDSATRGGALNGDNVYLLPLNHGELVSNTDALSIIADAIG